ncbi:hypothetical protein [Actinomadura algeriensis]|uniref:Uncharacterized protein n=1 Tax=Actinomadura algeriensis TaxID=1679523 RepID=A0ABR9JPJ5_9ACTN|nr:hypothetical protein [Actinomadura algeriensis]MBE1532494.1 hypothetical protein [Actinomadura algeriensis]
MRPTSLLDTIAATPWASGLLASVFDFDVTDRGHKPIEALQLASGDFLEAIAREAAGGTYFLCGDGGDERPVLYTNSEGGAALVGTSLSSALTTIIELPYWQDCLMRSDGGDLEKARAAIPALEGEYLADIPDLSLRRARLLDGLGLAPGDGVVSLLRAAADTARAFVVVTEDGYSYRSLL